MDITMIGLQNAGKTSLLRVLAVSHLSTTYSSPLPFPSSVLKTTFQTIQLTYRSSRAASSPSSKTATPTITFESVAAIRRTVATAQPVETPNQERC